LISCHLTKLESAFDQVRKSYPKVKPTDAALLSSALVLTGRHALAIYNGTQYRWPEDYEKLTKAMSKEFDVLGEVEPAKKTKTAPEEEPFLMAVGLTPNFSAGEKILDGRNDLKKLLSDALQEGVEYVYSTTDLGWQWALDHVNWSTVSGSELNRKVKVKATFTEGAVGVEMGAGGSKKRAAKPKAAAKAEPAEEKPAVEAKEAAPEPAEPEKVEASPAEEAKPKAKAAKAKAEPAAEEAKAEAKPAKAKAEPKKAEAKPKKAKAAAK